MDSGGCHHPWETSDTRARAGAVPGCSPAAGWQPGISWESSFPSVPEPTLWVFAEEVQEQQWLAETVGRLHQLLPVLLQDTPGGQV